MLTDKKAMDIARRVLGSYFKDTSFPLIQHHVDSFNDFIEKSIPAFIKSANPIELELAAEKRFIRVYIGGKNGDNIKCHSPVDDMGNAIVPHACRLDNLTYALNIRGDIDIDYVFTEGDSTSTITKSFKNAHIGDIPLMLRSNKCYLTAMDGFDIGECKYELGGYFIIDGAEKILLTQELLGNNMFYAGERKKKSSGGSPFKKGLTEREDIVEMPDIKYEEKTEYYVGIKSISEDSSRGPYSHFLVIPEAVAYITGKEGEIDNMKEPSLGRDMRLATITVRGFDQPIPLISLFRALGIHTDKDIYDIILAGVTDKDRIAYDDIFMQLVLGHERYLKFISMTDKELLKKFTHTKSPSEIVKNVYEYLFPHAEGNLTQKAFMLGIMAKMGIDLALGITPPSDRDNFKFKRFDTSGVLCFDEFRRIYREMSKGLLLNMDSRVQYESARYKGKNLAELIGFDQIGYYWKSFRMLKEFNRSFKGMWAKRSGISQELSRTSYAGTISHLRKTSLQIDKTASTAPPRRLYGSQWGLCCPTDSPDGSDIGYIKALTIMAHVSTAFPASVVRETVMKSSPNIRLLADIHPATWEPYWSKIFVNSDLFGVCMDGTETFHDAMVAARRNGTIGSSVSLAWNRGANEYRIYCDAGRPIRPVYRPGVLPDTIRKAKHWKDILKHLDYIDAAETDTLKISMAPFHPTLPSEIHMSFNMSALTNLVPYSDHNPGTRNAFSIAQQKQASAWYHTNYTKRFDTIAIMMALPQKPLSQTWMYREMMGPGGCLPYGENAIVAITTYGGYNQEDSVMLNKGSLDRGMFRTLYAHSYEVEEEMIDLASKTHTVFGNPLSVVDIKRKEGMDYSKLDADGIIKVNSLVDDDTILSGILSPVYSPSGELLSQRDKSVETKRGQRGRVDAVYRYATKDGLRGVKIRIVEERSPMLGDKMSSRHSQKGTVGMLLAEADMPFNSKGIRPDIIFNPHALPTRMTVGQFVESVSNKIGLKMGAFIDATPFTVSNRVKDTRDTMVANGFEPYGSEVLYNGMTGEAMEVDIFMGPVYYQALKQMVEDKINYRDTGPKTLLTHQPTQGRGDGGGLRIGEMERDALVSHGMSKFLTESMMERSDKTEAQFDRESGHFDTSKDTLTLPYAMTLFTRELEAMHIDVKLSTE
jgi:DNA-directed RNA polymerase II subunit RPB2